MTIFARVVEGVVAELWSPPQEHPDWTPAQVFHPDFPGEWVEATEGVDQRWTFTNGVFAAPPPPEQPLVDTVSDRQFFQQLAIDGEITEAEALAAVQTGAIPATIAAVVNAMPANQQFNAKMLLSGATVFERTHPMTAALASALGWSQGDIDNLWRNAAAL